MFPASRRFITRSELDAICGARLHSTRLVGLYTAGSIEGLAAPTVAVVGTRAPSEAGRRLARSLAQDLGAAGVCVISGLALGIDSAAHEGSLAARAPTIGVLGGGHDRFFPARNRELAARILNGGGAVVSPYAPDEPARPHQFLARNGIVAALADALVVVEAASRSGALNTASWAADRAIPVMAFPGDVDRPKVAGCLALIRDGALLVRDAADVLAELGLQASGKGLPGLRSRSAASTTGGGGRERVQLALAAAGLTAENPNTALARSIVERIASESAGIDALLASAPTPGAALASIGELLGAGIIAETDDGRLKFIG